jgi:hypothetical protein
MQVVLAQIKAVLHTVALVAVQVVQVVLMDRL